MKLPYQFIHESCGNSPEEAWARLVDNERADIEDGIKIECPIISKAGAKLFEISYISGEHGIYISYANLQEFDDLPNPPRIFDIVGWTKVSREDTYTFIGWITE